MLIARQLVLLCCAGTAALATERFDTDPGWYAEGNRPNPSRCVQVKQDFGWHPDRRAIGGTIERSLSDAFYAAPTGHLDLSQPLSASGKFTLPRAGDGGLYFGWFNDAEGVKPANFLGMRLMAGANGIYADPWMFTGTWRGYGTKYEIPIDLTVEIHSFQIDYSPTSNSGRGALRVIVDGKVHLLDLPNGFTADGASFNRFGLRNILWSPQATFEVFFDNLNFATRFGTVSHSFDVDPGWQEEGNRERFIDCRTKANQNFGWSAERRAIGGVFWRADPSEQRSFYGERISSRSFESPLTLSGTLAFTLQMVDSAMLIGCFNSATVNRLLPLGFLGLLIEGPTEDGHYIRPIYVTDRGSWAYDAEDPYGIGPKIPPDGVERSWSLEWRPSANVIIMTYDGVPYHYRMDERHRSEGGTLNHCGLLPFRRHGGGPMEIWVDNWQLDLR